MKVILTYAGLRPGGVLTDMKNLERGLLERDVDVTLVGSLSEVRLRASPPDGVLHVFSSMPSVTTFGSLAVGRARHLPLVWTPVFHPSRPHSWAGYGVGRAMGAYDRVVPHVARFVDGVIAATQAEAELFRRMGAPVVETIPSAVDATHEALYGEARRAARASFGIGDEPVVLVIARANNARRKGLEFARDAFRELRLRVPEVRLLLLGYGSEGPLVQEPGAIATGWVDQERAAVAYGCSDVLLVSSIYESLSRAAVEAWSHELPVVVTDRVALAPLVRQGAGEVVRYGDVASAADALERMVTGPGLARECGTAGRALVEDGFLLRHHVDRTLTVYHEVSGMIKTGRGAGRDHHHR